MNVFDRMKETILTMAERNAIDEFKAKEYIDAIGECQGKDCQIREMQAHIECLQAELKENQSETWKLPYEPIKVAAMLIYATERYKDFFGKENEHYVYDKSELHQIAEHLTAYCNDCKDRD